MIFYIRALYKYCQIFYEETHNLNTMPIIISIIEVKMHITFFEIQGWEKPMIKKALKIHSLKFVKEPLTLENVKLAKNSDIISIFIYSHLNQKILSNLKKLKFIATRSTGHDHINIKTCKNNR